MVNAAKFYGRMLSLLTNLKCEYDLHIQGEDRPRQFYFMTTKSLWNTIFNHLGISEETLCDLCKTQTHPNMGLFWFDREFEDDPYPYTGEVKLTGFRYVNHIARKMLEVSARFRLTENDVEFGEIRVKMEKDDGIHKIQQ